MFSVVVDRLVIGNGEEVAIELKIPISKKLMSDLVIGTEIATGREGGVDLKKKTRKGKEGEEKDVNEGREKKGKEDVTKISRKFELRKNQLTVRN